MLFHKTEGVACGPHPDMQGATGLAERLTTGKRRITTSLTGAHAAEGRKARKIRGKRGNGSVGWKKIKSHS